MRKIGTVKRLIAYNAILIACIGCLCVTVILLMEYTDARKSAETGLHEAGNRVASAVESFVERTDEIGKALFLSDDFQDLADAYIEDEYDLATIGRMTGMFASYASISRATVAIAFVPVRDGVYRYNEFIDAGGYHLLQKDNDFFAGHVDNGTSAKSVIIVDTDDSGQIYFGRNAIDLRENSPTFFQNKGFGLICVDKTKFVEEVSVSIYYEAFRFEVLYNDAVVAADFMPDGREKYLTDRVSIGDTAWSVVGYVAADSFGTTMRNNVATIVAFGLCALLIAVALSLLLNFYATKSYRYLIGNFNRIRNTDNPPEILPTDDPNVNEVIDSYNAMSRERDALTASVLQAERKAFAVGREKDRLEVDALYSQINKHFLFNAFSMIRAMVRDGEKQTAIDCINAIGVFLRYSLSPEQTVSLKQEFKALRSYVDVQRLRYGDVEYRVECADELEEYRIPKMVLQPIVENAFSHGNLGDGGKIRICVRKRKSGITVFVVDNGVGMDASACRKTNENLRKNIIDEDGEHNGLALGNIQHRLGLSMSDRCGIALKSRRGQGTVVVVRLVWGEDRV